MKRRIFWSIFLMSACVLLLSCGVFIYIYYNGISDQVTSRLRAESIKYAEILNTQESDDRSIALLSAVGVSDENRVTLIAPDGTVLYDNQADPSTMDNHAQRPEVAAATAGGIGEAVRQSDTIGEEIYYAAAKTEAGHIIRVSKTTGSIWGLIDATFHWIVFAVLLILIISILISRFLTKMLVRPFATLDLEQPLLNDTYEELSPLLKRISEQNGKISDQMSELSAKKKELEMITGNMNEGLIALDPNGGIVLANRTALRIFGGREPASYLQLCRETSFIDAVESAMGGKSITATFNIEERSYRMYANPADRKDGNYSVILFVMDISDKVEAEALRREFTANVSHELKTPLSSISAYAELIENGIAKSEDVIEFASQIRAESSRLLSLIEDIIRISQLDEGFLKDSFIPVSLSDICHDVIETLQDKAKAKGIELSCSCEDITISGIPAVLYEMVYNLLDNAIIYNSENGKAGVLLEKEDSNTVLSVWDTGVGIPAKHQSRVFERFYRVDKSHSKQTGGTGLGLSIVKHGAALHGAAIKLSSHTGKGTEVEIRWDC